MPRPQSMIAAPSLAPRAAAACQRGRPWPMRPWPMGQGAGPLAKALLILAMALGAALSPVAVGSAQAAIEFKGPIQWHAWEAGLKQASAKKKPILMLMHTDACPKCTLLGHVFNNNKDVQKIAKQLVMVHIDGGLAPLSLTQRFARFGSYVPKIVFLQPDGTPMEQITSGNGGFPYYFQPSRPENLMAAMQRAVDEQARLAQKSAGAKGAAKPAGRAAKQCTAGSAGC